MLLRAWLCLTRQIAVTAASHLLDGFLESSAVQSLARRLENGGVLSCPGVCPVAQSFLAALLRRVFRGRIIVAVAADLRAQELFHQDLATWMEVGRVPALSGAAEGRHDYRKPLFYPAWEVLPHDSKLPHADAISDRLDTLVALLNGNWRTAGEGRASLSPPLRR